MHHSSSCCFLIGQLIFLEHYFYLHLYLREESQRATAPFLKHMFTTRVGVGHRGPHMFTTRTVKWGHLKRKLMFIELT